MIVYLYTGKCYCTEIKPFGVQWCRESSSGTIKRHDGNGVVEVVVGVVVVEVVEVEVVVDVGVVSGGCCGSC